MSGKPTTPGDLRVFGTETNYTVIRADPEGGEKWLQTGPSCPLLGQHHIAHAGIMNARFPFEVARIEQSGTFMLACTGGRGVVLTDGRWTNVKAGEACLLPPFIHNALKCIPGEPWEFAWVRYKESRESAPVISAHSPVSGKLNGMVLKAGILGLHAEATGDNTPSAIHHWTELIHHYVIRFAQPHSSDQRLWKVWKRVEANFARQWTLADLAQIACMSPEHLRRTCSREIGRSPMRHLTYLRLKHAAELLSATDIKVEIVAREVGFENPFAFSNTFKKWFGWRPSEHRSLKRPQDASPQTQKRAGRRKQER